MPPLADCGGRRGGERARVGDVGHLVRVRVRVGAPGLETYGTWLGLELGVGLGLARQGWRRKTHGYRLTTEAYALA